MVIVRRIGEGAFAEVYSGEILSPGSASVPVAIKTLKHDIPIENERDFLNEVLLMKRFDHPNIVKMLGICIKAETLWLVLEFMPYGDLRTYLRARRHLVKEEALTGMALDVIKALSYLETLEYVHR